MRNNVLYFFDKVFVRLILSIAQMVFVFQIYFDVMARMIVGTGLMKILRYAKLVLLIKVHTLVVNIHDIMNNLWFNFGSLTILSFFIGDSCLINQFKCSNQKCISKREICNGEDNCGDFSDEVQNCSCKSNGCFFYWFMIHVEITKG